MYADILIPTDGSEGVEPAIEHGLELAARSDATVHALFVVQSAETATVPEPQWLTLEESLEEIGREAVGEIRSQARRRDIASETAVRHGTPHEEIVAYGEDHDVDLIVMGTHGRSGLERVLLGSVTENVIRHAAVPVLVQRVSATA